MALTAFSCSVWLYVIINAALGEHMTHHLWDGNEGSPALNGWGALCPPSTPSQALPLAGRQPPHLYGEPQGQPVQKEGALPGPLQKEAMMARMHTMLR